MNYGLCFYCDKEILSTDEKRIVPLDKPYINLWFHRACLDSIENVDVLLTQNPQKIYNYKEKRDLSTKNQGKSSIKKGRKS